MLGFVIFGVWAINRLEGEDFVTPFGRLNTSQLYTGLLIVAVPLGFLASPVSTLMWLIGLSIVGVGAHASLMENQLKLFLKMKGLSNMEMQ